MAEKDYVFISYSSKDIIFVKELTNIINNYNIEYWKAPEMIPAGSNYAREIPQAINKCAVFLLVVSATSQNSIWVEKEVDTAICARKKIIPIRIDAEPLNDMYRFYLNNVQMIEADIRNEEIINIAQIQEKISEILASKEVPDGAVRVKKSADVTDEVNSIQRPDKRSNALRINRIPLECEVCGGAVEQVSMGIYRCVKCNSENYDDFQKVRNYLEKVGTAPVTVISRNTGVPIRTIEFFWNEEFLEIPSAMDIRLACARCGAPIRAGSLCDKCKNNGLRDGRHTRTWKR